MNIRDSDSFLASNNLLRCSRCEHISSAEASYCASCGADLSESGVPLTMEPTQIHPSIGPDAGEPVVAARLVIQEGAKAGLRFTLQETITTIGRHPESHIFLSDLTVSRRHAEVIISEGGFEVRDAGSLNGTYVNMQRVDSARLQDGDIVQIGRFKLEYQAPQDAASAEQMPLN